MRSACGVLRASGRNISSVARTRCRFAQRRGELALARWSEIDFQERTWSIPDRNPKGERGHSVPLTSWAIEELRALKVEAERCLGYSPAKGGSKIPLNPKLLTRGMVQMPKTL